MSVSEQHPIILLAAGESSRMGQPKQLLKVRGTSLLRLAAEEATKSQLGPVVVVLGAFADKMEAVLENMVYDQVHNKHWQEGMGTSIKAGILHVQQAYPDCAGIIVMLCDQPYADAAHLAKLVQTYHGSHKPIIASAYKSTLGVPAYFHRSYFDRLGQLENHIGARKLIQAYSQDAAAVSFPMGGIDVDTPEDYTILKDKIAREEGVD